MRNKYDVKENKLGQKVVISLDGKQIATTAFADHLEIKEKESNAAMIVDCLNSREDDQ